MANIIPAILTDNLEDLQTKLNMLAEYLDYAQIDIMDGKFVDTVSITPDELKQVRTNIYLEAHLMVQDPKAWLPYINPDIFKRIYFHIEAVPDPSSLIKEIKELGFEVGLAINPETNTAILKDYAEYVDGVLFMSVTPGQQGQDLKREVLYKIKEFSLEFTDQDTAIDGGVNVNNIIEVADTGVTNICVGSAVFSGGNIRANLQLLKDKLT
jgi:ribulose-phosphate 3-epimerase